jgi:beta-glucosidase/6-phospho-beta-glucosidase/beta-galactosidase
MHYGCPLWLTGEFLHPDYAERVAEYAGAFAVRYRDLARLYTPLNEPLVTAHFCGRSGVWPPYRRGSRGYTAITMAVTRGIVLTVAALRAANPDAVMVHVEAAQAISDDGTVPPEDLTRARERQFLATDLVLGRLDDAHPYAPWLLGNGADPDDLAWHRAHPVDLDVLGVNFYATLSCWRFSATSGRTVRRRIRGTAGDLGDLLHVWSARYGRPLMVTETSEAGTPARRLRWLDESVAAVRGARAAGVDVRGYTWFPMLTHVRWDWRRGRRPTNAYWVDMGLWDFDEDGDGTLRRVETAVAAAFAARVAAGAP